jgi:hypothetical protein
MEKERDTINILGQLRREKEDAKTANKNATFFVAIGYLAGFVIMMYLGRLDIIAYISIFVFLLFAMVYMNFRQAKKDIQAIDSLYLEYEVKRNEINKKRS